MLKFDCPACGAQVSFKSSVTVFAVCSYCTAMIVRRDMDLETLGKMAALPPDQSALQIGTKGNYEGKAFELIGREKISWDGGSWNEWYALFDDGNAGWLAEAQGFYSVSFESSDLSRVPKLKDVAVGRSFPLSGNQSFEVDDIRVATGAGSEGELPTQSRQGRKSTSVDLTGTGNQFACLDYAEDGVRLFLGKYVDFDALHLTSLRQIDGW